jgi:hypothetical protein
LGFSCVSAVARGAHKTGDVHPAAPNIDHMQVHIWRFKVQGLGYEIRGSGLGLSFG